MDVSKYQFKNKMGIGYLLFPEEVWGLILEIMKDPQDVLNLINTYPVLSQAYKVKTPLWLFDPVFPHVFQWLSKGEVLATRGVCRGWRHGVDGFLENHPTHRPIQNENGNPSHATTPRPIPRASPRYYNLRERFPDMSFQQPEKFAEFLSAASKLPNSNKMNPFVGRSIEIKPRCTVEGIIEFWNGVLELFRQFGEQIWFLRIVDFVDDDPIHFWKSFMDCLAFLPNLKRLNLIVYTCFDSGFLFEDFFKTHRVSFPPLPQLESLEVNYIRRKSILSHMLRAFQPSNIRRLSLELSVWKSEYAQRFPNLTELNVSKISSKSKMSQLMSLLEAPGLSSLELRFGFSTPLNFGSDILPWLARFPRLHSFKLDTIPLFAPSGRRLQYPPSSSLTSLMIRNHYLLTYDFLLYFPFLEYLQICMDCDPDSTIFAKLNPLNVAIPCEVNLRDCLRDQSHNLYGSNVWEKLPKLKGINLWGRDVVPQKYFSRDGYDHSKKINHGRVD